MLTAWHVYLPIDIQSILLSVKLPSYLFWSSLVSNIQLMIDCGILSTVQVIVVVSYSLTTLSSDILEMVGWSTNTDKLKPQWIVYMYISTTFIFPALGPHYLQIANYVSSYAFRLSKLYVPVAKIYIIFPHSCIWVIFKKMKTFHFQRIIWILNDMKEK